MNTFRSLLERMRSLGYIAIIAVLALGIFIGVNRWRQQQKDTLLVLKPEVQDLEDSIAREKASLMVPFEKGKLKKWVTGDTDLPAVLKSIQEKAQERGFLTDIKEQHTPETLMSQSTLKVALYAVNLKCKDSTRSGFQDLLAFLSELAAFEQKIDIAAIHIQAPQKEGVQEVRLIISIWMKAHA